MSDLRDAFRALRATPVVTAVAILSLALGIGANTAIFSIVNALMLRALPVKEPQQLVQLLAGDEADVVDAIRCGSSCGRAIRELFDGAFAYSSPRFNLAAAARRATPTASWPAAVSSRCSACRRFSAAPSRKADDVRGGGKDGPVVVISYGFWQRRFGGAADVVGKTLALNRRDLHDHRRHAAGVHRPRSGTVVRRGAFRSASEPLMRGSAESALDQRSWWWLRVMARLKPGQTVDQATAALRGVQPQLREATIPTDWRPQDLPRYLAEPFNARPAANGPAALGARSTSSRSSPSWPSSRMVLLIACANIANLLLARATRGVTS